MITKRTETGKRVSFVVLFGLLALAAGSLGIYLVWVGWNAGLVGKALAWTAALVAFGVAGFLMLGTGRRSGPCPACGASNPEIATGQYRDCLECGESLTGNGAQLWLTGPDVVAKEPAFGAVLPERFAWPEGCAVCGKLATKQVPVSLTVSETTKNLAAAAAGAAVGRVLVKGSSVTYGVDVPHCPQHNDGARIETQVLGPVRLVFRSHKVARAFRDRNGLKAR